MDPGTIKEARRLLHDLIFTGKAKLRSGQTIQPKDEWLVTLLEKVASKKVEELDVPMTVEGYSPKETYQSHAKPKDGEATSS